MGWGIGMTNLVLRKLVFAAVLLFASFAISIPAFAAVPTVTALSLGVGPTGGGETVIITGSNFDTTPINNTVKFGSAVATVTAGTATSLTVTSPVLSLGGYDVTVQTTSGTRVC